MTGSAGRISAMILRYWYLLKNSWPRLFELWYWPTVFMIMWGFLQKFMMGNSDLFVNAFGILLAAVMLWDLMFRSQISLSLSFFEELWSRNVGHLMVSPLKDWEWVLALIVISLIRTVIGIIPATLLAIWFFDFSIYSLGPPLFGFFFLLAAFGWAVGLMVSGIVLRYGLGAESLAWGLMFGIMTLACIYYPLETLPTWLQPISLALPPTHVFEGMRMILIEGQVPWAHMAKAAVLDVLYLAGGVAGFLGWLRMARIRGMILQIGE